jgi:hypothetical protein
LIDIVKGNATHGCPSLRYITLWRARAPRRMDCRSMVKYLYGVEPAE